MNILDYIYRRMPTVPGWCDAHKALALYVAVRSLPLVRGVEIGVLSGRSLVAAGLGARDGRQGRVYGIDAYSADAAQAGLEPDGAAWWGAIDFAEHRRTAGRLIAELRLVPHCRLIRATSADAAARFQWCNYLHIDGNHSPEAVALDVSLWLPKVEPGGIVVMDDIDQAGVAAALGPINAACDVITAETKWGMWRRRT